MPIEFAKLVGPRRLGPTYPNPRFDVGWAKRSAAQHTRTQRLLPFALLLTSLPTLAQTPPQNPNPAPFEPSEQIEAGSAVSFPVDI